LNFEVKFIKQQVNMTVNMLVRAVKF
jgi:hypothetical protein